MLSTWFALTASTFSRRATTTEVAPSRYDVFAPQEPPRPARPYRAMLPDDSLDGGA